jgi:hypothetical protein
MNRPSIVDFESLEETNRPLLVEFWDFLRENKKWWLLPMLLVMLAMALLVTLSGTGAAPFIYTLF